MNKLLKTIAKVTLLMTIATQINLSNAGHLTGNGGDHVRGTFFKVGFSILDFLKSTAEGQSIVISHHLDLAGLEGTLDIQVVEVMDEALTDNRGSDVDAIGVPGKIFLNQKRWFTYFEGGNDIYYLVLHEMLRATGVDDDNYIISGAINPFPLSRRVVTRVSAPLPLVGEEQLDQILDFSTIAIAGTGCPGVAGTFVNVDIERSLLDITFDRYVAHTSNKNFDRKNCQLSIPMQAPAGKKLILTQVDLLGEVDQAPQTHSNFNLEVFHGTGSAEVSFKTAKTVESDQTAISGGVLMRESRVLESGCGQIANLRLASSIAQKNGALPERSKARVKRMTIYFKLEDCSP